MIYIISILFLITLIYCLSICWVIYGLVKIEQKANLKLNETNVTPQQISVVIAVRNEASNIIRCLNALKAQYYNRFDYEIIVVNDHSTDDTVDLINDYRKNSEVVISLYELQETSSKKEALKYGISKANNPIIATTDADCIVPEEWLNNISRQFNNSANMLLGPVMFSKKPGFLSGFQTLDMLAIQGIEFGTIFFKRPILNNGANLSYLKKNYNELKGFDDYNTPSGDDIFLLEKFRTNDNYQIQGLLSKNFIVLTEPHQHLKAFINQRLRWSSKAKYYSNRLLIFYSMVVLLQNISLIFVYVVIPLVEKYRLILLILLLTKWLIDFILLFLVASFFKRKKALFYFIPVQIIYPLYVIFIWIMSMTVAFEWKGRKYNG